MTSLQVEYWKNRETQRHNIQMEKLTGEAQAEAARHNVQSENIGYAQANASYLQAQAAMRNAQINQHLAELQHLKYEYEEQIAYHQMQMIDAQTKNYSSQYSLNTAKAAMQVMENGVYSLWGTKQAGATYHSTQADIAKASAQAALWQAQAGYYTAQTHTESFKQADYVFNMADKLASRLFGDQKGVYYGTK